MMKKMIKLMLMKKMTMMVMMLPSLRDCQQHLVFLDGSCCCVERMQWTHRVAKSECEVLGDAAEHQRQGHQGKKVLNGKIGNVMMDVDGSKKRKGKRQNYKPQSM